MTDENEERTFATCELAILELQLRLKEFNEEIGLFEKLQQKQPVVKKVDWRSRLNLAIDEILLKE